MARPEVSGIIISSIIYQYLLSFLFALFHLDFTISYEIIIMIAIVMVSKLKNENKNDLFKVTMV